MNHLKLWEDESFAELGRKSDISMETIGVVPLLKNAIRAKGKLFEASESGSQNEPLETYEAKIIELGGTLLYKFVGESWNSSIWTWEDSMVELQWGGSLTIKVLSRREELVNELRKFVRGFFQPPKTHGQVYAIVYSGGRLAMSSLGNAGIPLVRQNYTKKVLEDYEFVVQDLKSSVPSGRLAILEGEPGTGKTHLVRALLTDVDKGMFVLVSPDMIKSMGGPELLPLLMQYHSYTPGPIILVIEDADKCLVTRADKDSDTSVIQSILNLGDGILGSMLDIRILATTNAKKFQMDDAILRRGRLSRRIEVNGLDAESVRICYGHLIPGFTELPAKLIDSSVILADVYGIARENGWKPDELPAVPDEDEVTDNDDIFDEDEEEDDDD